MKKHTCKSPDDSTCEGCVEYATPKGWRLEFQNDSIGRHQVARVLAEWNQGRQDHVFVVIHSPKCLACRLENRLAEQKDGKDVP